MEGPFRHRMLAALRQLDDACGNVEHLADEVSDAFHAHRHAPIYASPLHRCVVLPFR